MLYKHKEFTTHYLYVHGLHAYLLYFFLVGFIRNESPSLFGLLDGSLAYSDKELCDIRLNTPANASYSDDKAVPIKLLETDCKSIFEMVGYP